ncbi:MAG: hypothetical protein A2Y77_07285 [Planctomycetes bacterium RBG_13_62_9]|nr:MAG: hypothetical protein A2Y77_07285 [Planctomycetes bacterium RBG_13_62_9]
MRKAKILPHRVGLAMTSVLLCLLGTVASAGEVADPASASTAVAMNADHTLHRQSAPDQHTLTITCDGDGTVKAVVVFEGTSSPLMGEGVFVLDHGTQVTITATAEAGWQFARWTGTIASGESTLEFILTGDTTLVAHFALDPRTLTVTSGPGGRIVQPGVGVFVCEQATTMVIEAVCDRGYGFAGWTGTAVDKGFLADPARSRTQVTVHEDCTLHANFEQAVRQFHESWETAEVTTHTPSDSTIFGADEGPWALGDDISNSGACGPTPNRAEVLALDGGQALLLTSSDSNSTCSDAVWVAMDESGLVHEGAVLPLDANTVISFYEVGRLDAPAVHGSGADCERPPCFDSVSILLTDNRGSVLVYVLQRPGEAVANVPNAYLGGVYREVFLDPSGVHYQRNVFDDFRTIPAFNTQNSALSSVEFRVGEHGSAILDELAIGPAAMDATIPVYAFRSSVLGSRFVTAEVEEKQMLIDTYPDLWQFEGICYFTPAPDSDPNLAPVYRFWSPVHSSHFYTTSQSERDMLLSEYPDVWTLEGTAFHVFGEGRQPANAVPVYRFWSPTLNYHLFTAVEAQKEDLMRDHSSDWSFEGVAWYVYPPTWDSAGALELLGSSSAK